MSNNLGAFKIILSNTIKKCSHENVKKNPSKIMSKDPNLICFAGLLMVFLSGYLIEVTQSWTTVFSLITLVNSGGLAVYLLFGDARRLDLEYYSPLTVV